LQTAAGRRASSSAVREKRASRRVRIRFSRRAGTCSSPRGGLAVLSGCVEDRNRALVSLGGSSAWPAQAPPVRGATGITTTSVDPPKSNEQPRVRSYGQGASIGPEAKTVQPRSRRRGRQPLQDGGPVRRVLHQPGGCVPGERGSTGRARSAPGGRRLPVAGCLVVRGRAGRSVIVVPCPQPPSTSRGHPRPRCVIGFLTVHGARAEAGTVVNGPSVV